MDLAINPKSQGSWIDGKKMILDFFPKNLLLTACVYEIAAFENSILLIERKN